MLSRLLLDRSLKLYSKWPGFWMNSNRSSSSQHPAYHIQAKMITNNLQNLWIPLIPIASLALGVYAKSHLQYEWGQSLYAPYISVDGRNNNWDFDALVSMHNFIQLTPELPHKVGWAFSKTPLEANDWTVDFFFRISGDNPADGMAFWFSEDHFQPGKAFGYKENFKGLGVFFDVFKNHGTHHPHPWISAMVGDGKRIFDHNTDGAEYSLGGCHRDILNTEHPVQARVTYNKENLDISLKFGEEEWQSCMRVGDVKLPKRGYIGFTAATGGLAAKQELFGVACATIEHDISAKKFTPHDIIRHESLVPKVLLLVFICSGIGGLGFMYFNRSMKRHQF